MFHCLLSWCLLLMKTCDSCPQSWQLIFWALLSFWWKNSISSGSQSSVLLLLKFLVLSGKLFCHYPIWTLLCSHFVGHILKCSFLPTFFSLVLGVKFRVSCMLGKYSTTELCLQPPFAHFLMSVLDSFHTFP